MKNENGKEKMGRPASTGERSSTAGFFSVSIFYFGIAGFHLLP
jgi:hypothetical protein